VPRLTLLAPNIVEVILVGRQASEVTLPSATKVIPAEWGMALMADQNSDLD